MAGNRQAIAAAGSMMKIGTHWTKACITGTPFTDTESSFLSKTVGSQLDDIYCLCLIGNAGLPRQQRQYNDYLLSQLYQTQHQAVIQYW
jgi:hypothetical protein